MPVPGEDEVGDRNKSNNEGSGQEHRGAQQQVVTCEAQSEGIPHLSVLKQAASASA